MWSLKGYLFSNMKCEAVEYPSSLLEIRSLMAPGGTVTQAELQAQVGWKYQFLSSGKKRKRYIQLKQKYVSLFLFNHTASIYFPFFIVGQWFNTLQKHQAIGCRLEEAVIIVWIFFPVRRYPKYELSLGKGRTQHNTLNINHPEDARNSSWYLQD